MREEMRDVREIAQDMPTGEEMIRGMPTVKEVLRDRPTVPEIVRAWPNPQTLITNRETDVRSNTSNEQSAPGSPSDLEEIRHNDRP